jgi:hypothetical protein
VYLSLCGVVCLLCLLSVSDIEEIPGVPVDANAVTWPRATYQAHYLCSQKWKTKLAPQDRHDPIRKAYYERGKPVIYVILRKALYGTLQAALLFWENISSQMQEWGFEINPYDLCVANKTIDQKQCTIMWHVDDLKI